MRWKTLCKTNKDKKGNIDTEGEEGTSENSSSENSMGEDEDTCKDLFKGG